MRRGHRSGINNSKLDNAVRAIKKKKKDADCPVVGSSTSRDVHVALAAPAPGAKVAAGFSRASLRGGRGGAHERG